jgi:hypothetical protein
MSEYDLQRGFLLDETGGKKARQRYIPELGVKAAASAIRAELELRQPGMSFNLLVLCKSLHQTLIAWQPCSPGWVPLCSSQDGRVSSNEVDSVCCRRGQPSSNQKCDNVRILFRSQV